MTTREQRKQIIARILDEWCSGHVASSECILLLKGDYDDLVEALVNGIPEDGWDPDDPHLKGVQLCDTCEGTGIKEP